MIGERCSREQHRGLKQSEWGVRCCDYMRHIRTLYMHVCTNEAMMLEIT